ncbi:nitronate monooxygenase [Undibacterium sp. RTI2.1]|uniref:NAD(P)H-dependent flavin oxidoreductase n=1 Tax=unclassified Undibacterium TaxID=2630295 RepID=UPI002B2310D5|nr:MULTISPECIES: nitronate monooxygenase [unclassified Undibacterium]MEB0030736.1 nitronate monooxygenase [Undibacterium sp. RTI2.1]MEB0117145.1 nitronate monooxygenase [Undibacterium sp. RTI2.2]
MSFKLQAIFPHPIIQGPMAGGASTPDLVAAVSNAGGLGSLAGGMLSPVAIIEHAELIRQRTDRPFAINLFVQDTPTPSEQEIACASELLKPIWSEFGWDKLPLPARWCEDFEAQLQALIIARPAVASFTFDILQPSHLLRLHEAGIAVIGTATNVQEALAWQSLGADAVCLSGTEAGGHRGTFIGAQEDATLTTMELLVQAKPHLQIPIIVAGNVMAGADIAAALTTGANAVQMGTAFLVTHESGIHPAYKQKLLEVGKSTTVSTSVNTSSNKKADATRQTRAFTGRMARGLDNRFMQIMQDVAAQVPAYPVQNALTASIRAHAGKTNDTGLMSLWAGQGVHRARGMPAAELMRVLLEELHAEMNTKMLAAMPARVMGGTG